MAGISLDVSLFLLIGISCLLATADSGEDYGYKQGSTEAVSTDVMNVVLDRDNATCLQFLSGAGGAAPWYTHVTFSSQNTAGMNVSILGHNLGCGKSLFVGLLPQNISMSNQGTQNGKKTACKVISSSMENGMETCTLRCSCPGSSCNRLDIIHRPMSQPSDWQLCEIISECLGFCTHLNSCADANGTSTGTKLCSRASFVASLINTGSDTFCAPVEDSWMILFRRVDGSEDFQKTWAEYKEGFGDLTKEFWIGNENMHQLTTNGSTYRLRIDMTLGDGKRKYAEYSQFAIASEADKYRITLSGYSGDAGDRLTTHNNSNFATVDVDNDASGAYCALRYVGAWWYTHCFNSKLTGIYGNGFGDKGINWGHNVDMLFVEFKVQVM